jgi:hypothetical protein
MALEKAVFYNALGKGKPFDIINRNADGTVDIGIGDKPVVRKCPVSKFAKPGHATIGAEPAGTEPAKVSARCVATDDEIKAEMRDNLRAANDWWQAKTLVEHRLKEQADIAQRFPNAAEFRATATA